ncbi:MAG: hypothetical protein SNI83_00410 [Rikenellaceae bacterium]
MKNTLLRLSVILHSLILYSCSNTIEYESITDYPKKCYYKGETIISGNAEIKPLRHGKGTLYNAKSISTSTPFDEISGYWQNDSIVLVADKPIALYGNLFKGSILNLMPLFGCLYEDNIKVSNIFDTERVRDTLYIGGFANGHPKDGKIHFYNPSQDIRDIINKEFMATDSVRIKYGAADYNNQWIIPYNTHFVGDLSTVTGAFDKPLNASSNSRLKKEFEKLVEKYEGETPTQVDLNYVGEFKNGLPIKGTIVAVYITDDVNDGSRIEIDGHWVKGVNVGTFPQIITNSIKDIVQQKKDNKYVWSTQKLYDLRKGNPAKYKHRFGENVLLTRGKVTDIEEESVYDDEFNLKTVYDVFIDENIIVRFESTRDVSNISIGDDVFALVQNAYKTRYKQKYPIFNPYLSDESNTYCFFNSVKEVKKHIEFKQRTGYYDSEERMRKALSGELDDYFRDWVIKQRVEKYKGLHFSALVKNDLD